MNTESLVKLSDKVLIYVFDVKPFYVYELRFFIVSKELEEVHHPCLMYLDFDGYILSEDERKLNALSFSDKVGYFKYIKTTPLGEIFHKKIFIPQGVYKLRIGFMTFKNRSEHFISKDMSFSNIPIDYLLKQTKKLKQTSQPIISSDIISQYQDIYQKYNSIPDDYISMLESKFSHQLPELYESLYQFFISKSYKKAIFYAESSLSLKADNTVLRKSLAKLYVQNGFIQRAFYCISYDIDLIFKFITIDKLKKIATRLNKNAINVIVVYILKCYPYKKKKLTKYSFSILKDIYPSLALVYGEEYIYLSPDDYKFIKVFISRVFRLQMYKKVVDISKFVNFDEDVYLISILVRSEIKLALEKCRLLYNNHPDKLSAFIYELEETFSMHSDVLYKELFHFYYDKSYSKAKLYLEKAINIDSDEKLIKNLYDLNLRYGHIQKALKVIPPRYSLEALKVKKARGEVLKELLLNGISIDLKKDTSFQPIDMKICYLLHNRLPYNSGGYASRTHGLLTNISNYGWDIHGVSRLGYPEDKMHDIISQKIDIIDDIHYHRLRHKNIGLGKIDMKRYLQVYAEVLYDFARKEKPSIIHAASNHMNGLVGNAVAKALGIPSVYEVRGLWEITRISREPQWKDTDYYNLMVKLETQAAKDADVVLTLTEALKSEMIARGISQDKIYIIPNGVTSERFVPRQRDCVLEYELGLSGKCVIGYIGSVVAYEGLELLIDAVSILDSEDTIPFAVLIVGDGALLDSIKKRAKEKGVMKYFIFTGRVAHKDVERYYSLVDIAPFPRLAQPVCEMVSPLKPFEAMATQKAVIASDVNALAEIVKDGYNGLLFKKESIHDFAIKLKLLINNESLRNKLGENARYWVKQERDWSIIAKKVDIIYKKL